MERYTKTIRNDEDARAFLNAVGISFNEVQPGIVRTIHKCGRCNGTGIFSQFHGVCYDCGGRNSTRAVHRHLKKYAQRLKRSHNARAKTAAANAARVDEKRAAEEAAEIAAPLILPAVVDLVGGFDRLSPEAYAALGEACAKHPAAPDVRPGLLAAKVRKVHVGKLKEERELERAANPSKAIGNVGDRIDVLAKLVWHHYLASDRWGDKRILKFETADGDKVTVFDSYRPAFSMIPTIPNHAYGVYDGETEEDAYGRWYAIKGTVKTHDEYKGEISTVLLRCKAEEVEGPAAEEPEPEPETPAPVLDVEAIF